MRLTRRRLVMAGGALLAAPLAMAQAPGRSYRLGVLLPMGGLGAAKPMSALKELLAAQGFIEGRNLSIDARFGAESSDAKDLVASRPDAILAYSTVLTQAAQRATNAVPIVFVSVADPVLSGIVKEYARPGGNITGVTNRFFVLGAKRLELIRELLPSAKRVAVAAGVFDATVEVAMRHIQEASGPLGFELIRAEAGLSWRSAMEDAIKAGADAILLITPFSLFGILDSAREVVRVTNDRRVPAVFADVEPVAMGGLMSYTSNQDDALRRAADLLARVLRGEKPGELAVDQAARFELAVNLKTARAMGLTIPQSILLRANTVIE